MTTLFGKAKTTKSPLSQKSLPQAGRSLDAELHDRLSDATSWVVVIVLAAVWSGLEWLRYWLKIPYAPVATTIMAALLSAFAIWRVLRTVRVLPQLQLGLRGERIVGEMLESSRASGYRVFHDIAEDHYNIDHVIIGPAGVFSIETKTRSKPLRGNSVVTFDGETVRVNGMRSDRDPIVQAKAAARRIRDILTKQTGSEVWVTPVVLFPGWFVENTVKTADEIVMNEVYFAKWITGRERKLSQQRIDQLAAGMDRYLRR